MGTKFINKRCALLSKDDDMQIIIPMTGLGSRFKAQGYERLKPFIKVHNRPMIEWVVKLFPGDESKITFICQRDHLNSLDYMKPELERIAPNARIFAIDDWKKDGPVAKILAASDVIDDNKPVLISYCDFYMHWDYLAFKTEAVKRNCDGAIPCYSGFHPHLIPKDNLYASCKVDEEENLLEIREKFSWEKDKSLTRHSPGVYYFKSGYIMKKYCQQLIEASDNINGEYYMSLPYNYLVKDGLKVWCPVNVDRFCQWGTPHDLENHISWINIIKSWAK
jgi:NDP-sugar pyrophosphorylase family protein